METKQNKTKQNYPIVVQFVLLNSCDALIVNWQVALSQIYVSVVASESQQTAKGFNVSRSRTNEEDSVTDQLRSFN